MRARCRFPGRRCLCGGEVDPDSSGASPGFPSLFPRARREHPRADPAASNAQPPGSTQKQTPEVMKMPAVKFRIVTAAAALLTAFLTGCDNPNEEETPPNQPSGQQTEESVSPNDDTEENEVNNETEGPGGTDNDTSGGTGEGGSDDTATDNGTGDTGTDSLDQDQDNEG